MKKLFGEFRDFIARGSVIDLAVGVIIGAAFGSIVNSLVNDILSPLIGLAANTHLDALVWRIGDVQVGYGAFLAAVINFLLMAIVLFLLVKTFDRLRGLGRRAKRAAPEAPALKTCPYCLSEIPAAATRCPHCTSEL